MEQAIQQLSPKEQMYQALNNLNTEMKSVVRNTKAYNYKYADIKEILDIAKPAMKKHGLAICHTLSTLGSEYVLVSMLIHIGGDCIQTSTPLILTKKDMQSLGSAITYAKRYAIQSLLNMSISDFDDDGESIKEDKASKSKKSADQKKISADQYKSLVELMGGDKDIHSKILSDRGVRGFSELFESDLPSIKRDIMIHKNKTDFNPQGEQQCLASN